MQLSIIIPVYNTSKYLNRCLDSVINARIDNSEIIVINDGSTDNSEEIIKEYLNKYSFIRYISKQNEGLGATKNLGIKEAKGKYLSFIDSDDSINPNFYKDAINYMNDDYDLIVYDFLSIEKDKEYTTYAKDPIFKNLSDYEGILYTTIMPSSCNKIMKKEVITKSNVLFPQGLRYEDFATTPVYLLNSKKVKYLNKPYYNYYINENSIMHKKNINYDMSYVLKLLDTRLKKYNNYDRDKFVFYNYIWRLESFLLNPLYTLSLKDRFKYSIKLYKNNHNIFRNINKNKYVIESLNNFDDKTKDFIIKRNKLLASHNILGFNYFLFKNARETKIYDIENKYYD